MKILQINTFPHGGAFTRAYRLHLALLKSGIASKMLIMGKQINNSLEEVYYYNKATKSINFLHRISTNLEFSITAIQKQ